ncbi:hypothetical protein ABW636_22235 [Aquimarina sp. 2201CG1-2-11]|uniref:hypothetical protein n=1 Tax=Aquimarina discodermiae TaxID=3231043 RepID=UPI003462740E
MNTHIPEEKKQEQLALIGEFVVSFELICAMIRQNIIHLNNGSQNEDVKRSINILLEDQTAYPLNKKALALFHHHFNKDKYLQDLAKKVKIKFEKMIELRNTIIHGTILTCTKSLYFEKSKDDLMLIKPKITGLGYNQNAMKVENKTLKNLIYKNSKIYWCFYNLYVIITHPETTEYKQKYADRINEKLDEIGSINLILK